MGGNGSANGHTNGHSPGIGPRGPLTTEWVLFAAAAVLEGCPVDTVPLLAAPFYAGAVAALRILLQKAGADGSTPEDVAAVLEQLQGELWAYADSAQPYP